jgi:hypothetical protein
VRHLKTGAAPRKKAIVKTTFLELIGKLIETTRDDDAVVASIRRIFADCNARMARSLAPVRLANRSNVKLTRRAAAPARI